jgi:protein-disulfide isomerase
MTREGLIKRCPLLAGFALALAVVCDGTAQELKREILAEIDGTAITAEEVDKAIGLPLQRLQEQIYSMRRQALRGMITNRLVAAEAAKGGISVQQLLDAEVTPQIGVVTEQEVETFYQANKTRFARQDEAQGREQARAMLQAQRRTKALEAYVQTLEARANVVVHLQAPPVVRVEVPVNGGIVRGGDQAPVTLVEFTDFHCPFCKRAAPIVEELVAKFGDRVRHVHRDFPIARLHPEAPRVHVAARCADEQGKFWAYHDKVFAGPAQSSPEQLKTYAHDIGLDVAAFEQCLSGSKHEADVQQDIEEGSRLGVTGTPTFFINGRPLVGAQPIGKFVELIEEELSEAQTRK